jgi:hypothetical protein
LRTVFFVRVEALLAGAATATTGSASVVVMMMLLLMNAVEMSSYSRGEK